WPGATVRGPITPVHPSRPGSDAAGTADDPRTVRRNGGNTMTNLPAGSPVRVRPFDESDRAFLIEIMMRLVPERTGSPRDPEAVGRYLTDQATGARPLAEGTELYIAVDEAGERLGLLGIRKDE